MNKLIVFLLLLVGLAVNAAPIQQNRYTTNLDSATINGSNLTNVFSTNGVVVFPNFAAIATTKPTMIGQIGIQINGGGGWPVYVANSLTTGDWISRYVIGESLTIGTPLAMPMNNNGGYAFNVTVNGNIGNQNNGLGQGTNAQSVGQMRNMSAWGGSGFFGSEVTNSGAASSVVDDNAVFFGWINDNAGDALFGGNAAVVLDPGRRFLVGGPINVGSESGLPNHELMEWDQTSGVTAFNTLQQGNNNWRQAGATYGLFINKLNVARGASFVSPSNYYAGGNYYLGTNNNFPLTDSTGLLGTAFDRGVDIRLDNGNVNATNYFAVGNNTGTLGYKFVDQSGMTTKANGNVLFNTSGPTLVYTLLSTAIRFEGNTFKLLWGPGGATDTGISRLSSGVVKIEDGSGNNRDLIDRNTMTQVLTAGTILSTNGIGSSFNNLAAPTTISVTASPFTFTAPAGFNIEVYIGGGIVTAISKNATVIATGLTLTGLTTIGVQPGETITVTYTSAPTMKYSSF